jgi:SAM-dependent methyltransferase
MTGAVAARVGRYILDGSDADLRRLLDIAQISEDAAQAALSSVGVQEGWRALECGCGPIGALPVLADLVGPSGRVLGLDFVESTVRRARSVIAELALDNVDVRVADVNAPGFSAIVGDPVDLAFTRCFLMHQRDLTDTITRIAGVVRPGGWIVAQEPMRSPVPRSHPELGALATYWELVHQTMESAGASPRTVDDLREAALAAGLEVVRLSGFFLPLEPARGFEVHAATAAAAKERAVSAGIATEGEIDRLVADLRAAMHGDYEWVSTPFFLELIARKPAQLAG